MLPLYWVKDTQDLSELFLTIACQSVITSKYKVFFAFLGSHMQHMEVPSLGVKSELQLLAYTTVTATQDLSCFCKLHHSSQQCWILNPLIEARDETHNLMIPSQIHFRCATTGTPVLFLF